MAEMRVEHTVEGKDIRYIVHVHPETFNWFTSGELITVLLKQFNRLITEIEQSPIFKKLYQKEKLIRHQKFPRTGISSRGWLSCRLAERLCAKRSNASTNNTSECDPTNRHFVNQL